MEAGLHGMYDGRTPDGFRSCMKKRTYNPKRLYSGSEKQILIEVALIPLMVNIVYFRTNYCFLL